MSGIDQRVVDMQFDNKAFGRGVRDSLKDLDNLKKGLRLEGASKGIDDVQKSASRFSLGNVSDGLTSITAKFSALGVIGFTVLQNLTNSAIDFGKSIVGSLLDPLIEGGKKRALNIAQAKFQFKGLGMDVEATMASALAAVKGTAFGLDEAAVAASQFGASGIKAGDEMTAALRGISGVAAMAGSSYSDIADVFTKVAGQGRLMGDDLNRLGTRGINAAATLGKAMGKSEEEIRSLVTKGKISFADFSKAMSDAFGEHATKASETYTGALSNMRAALARIGADVATPAYENQRRALVALTPVIDAVHDALKPLLDLMSGAMSASSERMVKFFESIDVSGLARSMPFITEAIKNIFTTLGAIFGPIKDAFREIFPPKTADQIVAIATAIRDFTEHLKVGAAMSENIKRTFAGLFAVLDIGWQLFKAGVKFIAELIGHFSKGGGSILQFTGNIGDFLVKIDQAIKKGDLFGKFFKKLTPWVEAPIDGLKKLVGWIVKLVKAIVSSDTAEAIVDRFKKNFDQMAAVGEKVGNAWEKTKRIFSALWKAIQPVVKKIGEIFKEIAQSVGDFLSKLSFGDLLAGAGVGAFILLVNKIRKTIDNLFNRKDDGPGVFDKVKESLGQLTETLKSMQTMLKATALLEIAAAIGILTIAVSVLSKIDAAGLSLATAAISAMVIQLTASMFVMDKMMKRSKAFKLDMIAAGMILLAIAINILASAAKKMADLDWNELAKGLTGTIVLLAALAATMKLMPEQSKMISSGAGVLLIAAAIKVLVSAVKDIADMSWEEMSQGLTGVAALLTSLALYTKFSNLSSIGDGAGIVLIAAGIKVLASAMKDMADMSWEDMAKGLSGVASSLGSVVVAMKLLPKRSVLKGLAVIEVSAALKIIASALNDVADLDWNQISKGVTALSVTLAAVAAALKLVSLKSALGSVALLIAAAGVKVLAGALVDLGDMSWSDIAAGLTVLAGSLVILAFAMGIMAAPTFLLGAAALVVGAFGLKFLADAMVTMGGMSWSDIAAAIVAMAGALLVLAVGLTAMIVALPGAVALMAAGPGLRMLAEVMVKLGAMSWSDIGAAIGGLAAMFAVLAIGGALSPLILALGIALGALGVAVAIIASAIKNAGQGINAFADGLTKLSKIDPEGLKNIGNAIDAVIEKLPGLATAAADAIGNFITELGVRAPDIANAFGEMVSAAATEMGKRAPEVISTFGQMIVDSLDEINNRMPDIITKGADVIVNFLDGLATEIPRIAMSAAKLVATFLIEIGNLSGIIVDAGFQMVIKFLNGLADAIEKNADQVKTAAARVGKAIIDGITGGVDDNQGGLFTKIGTMASGLLQKARDILGVKSPSKKFEEIGKFVAEGFAKGIAGHPEPIESAVDQMIGSLMDRFDDAMQSNLDDIERHNDRIASLSDQLASNAQSIAEAQAAVNEAVNTPIKLSTAKKAADRNAQNAAAQAAKDKNVAAAQKKLNDLIGKQNEINNAIGAERAAINENTSEYNRLNAARSVLLNQLTAEKAKLNDLANQRDINNQAIEDEQRLLEDAIQTRDDYNKSLREQYGTQEDISQETKLSDYVKNLQEQIVATQQFTIAIQELRKRGLNDELYKMLLSKGPNEAMPFVQQLLEGGQEALDDLNYLGKTLDEAAGVLGDDASSALYQAGVDAANGILEGLKSKQADIQAQMDEIANYMVIALNKALGIRSPSRVMAEIGSYAAQGVAKGLNDSAKLISKASEGVGQSAIDSMKKTISGLGDLIAGEVDVNPTISPVLDLSNIQRDASSIGKMLSAQPISVGSSYAAATDAMAGYTANQAAYAEAFFAQQEAAPITFVQNNNSPKALSQAEIYRQTNNQLSVAKGALTSNARKS